MKDIFFNAISPFGGINKDYTTKDSSPSFKNEKIKLISINVQPINSQIAVKQNSEVKKVNQSTITKKIKNEDPQPKKNLNNKLEKEEIKSVTTTKPKKSTKKKYIHSN
eukprot:TRINITY_DN15263_c0_g1_i1.p1 TRINITY_DN15263_c0_g1~~TRINITY_DN15263_c0_g1_i1.p1  ORF type:complete len:108 (+),score=26.80 TRINITY_DN15263_c0_g1_i1:517-840(+)